MPSGVYDRTNVVPWNKGLKGWCSEKTRSEETKRKIALAHKGLRHTDETKAKLSKHFKGKPIKEETRLKIQATMRAKFVGHTYSERPAIRKSTDYLNWRQEILERFNYTCVLCGSDDKSKLSVDHIRPIRLFPELALDIGNGRVVCSPCHVKLPSHGSASRKGNG